MTTSVVCQLCLTCLTRSRTCGGDVTVVSHLSDQVQNLRVRLLGVERAEDVQRDIHKRLHGVVQTAQTALQEMTDTLPTQGGVRRSVKMLHHPETVDGGYSTMRFNYDDDGVLGYTDCTAVQSQNLLCDIFLEMKMFRRDVLVFNVLRASANDFSG